MPMLAALLLSLLTVSAQSQTLSTTRSSSFSYGADGLLLSELIEPGDANACVATSYAYDAYGNKATSAGGVAAATTTNCPGASGLAQFEPRSSTSVYATYQVGMGAVTMQVPAGHFPTSVINALGQSETRVTDPRFGTLVRLTGPNGLTTTWELDDYGRQVKELRADGTSTRTAYCLIGAMVGGATGSNSADCASLDAATPTTPNNAAPALAVRYEHSVPLNTSGTPMGAYTRVYYDRAGRAIRKLTEAYDGSTQPGGTARLIVQDTDYNEFGAAVVSTQPYFLDKGSSTAGGTGSRLLVGHAWAFAILATVVAFAIWRAWRHGILTSTILHWADSVAPVRRRLDEFRLAKLFQALALMSRGGFPLEEALGRCGALGLGRHMSHGVSMVREDLARGRKVSDAMRDAGLTDMVTERLLRVGERSGNFDQVLQTISERHGLRFATAVERATRLAEPLLLMAVSFVVGGVVVLMYMPVFDIAGSLK